MPDKPAVRPGQLAWVAFFTAVGVLGFEIGLMRLLLVASWHHFAFLVISVALLGFGASGTGLFLLRRSILPRSEGILFALVLLAGGLMPICAGLAQHIPIEARVVPALFWRQLGCWIVYWAVLGLPFLFGAGAIGLTLMLAGKKIAGIYTGNLLGSACGCALATVAMGFVQPQWLPVMTGGTVLIGALGLRPGSVRVQSICWSLTVGVAGFFVLIDPPQVRLDPYKRGAYVQRLVRQDQAQRIVSVPGARALLEVFRSDLFHDVQFLSGGVAPPPIAAILADGHLAGSVLEIDRPQDAQVVDQTIMSFPYALLPDRPHVLLLGEVGGSNVWLAARKRAASIHVVQPDANVVAILRGPMKNRGGGFLDLPNVHAVVEEPRHFVDHTAERFDLIQLAGLEWSAAGSGGVAGLGQNHLITVEGIAACLGRLTDAGLLTVTRGIQDPPRDNIKLLATIVAALRERGVADPASRIAIVRDYLAVCTVVGSSPWSRPQIQAIRRNCADRQLTPVWFPGVKPEELNTPDALAVPPDGVGDWYHYAAKQLFSASAQPFIDDWPFDIRPPLDDRPFFFDFCKISSLGELKRAYGDLWLTRTELSLLFVLAAILIVGVAGALLTVLPLLLLRGSKSVKGRGPVAAYFTAIGLGYLLLEMTFLSRLTHWIGDSVTAAAVTIAGFLLFSGLGSLTVQRLGVESTRAMRYVILCLIACGLIELAVSREVTAVVGSLPRMFRCAGALLAIAPLAYLMGFPMPAALARLDRHASSLVPWAWGVNGFASVLAAPLATAIGMSWGFQVSGGLGLLLYVVPMLLFSKLPLGGSSDSPR